MAKRKPLTDEEMDKVEQMWGSGASRGEILEFIGASYYDVFDRTAEERGKGRLLHPRLKELPRHQGRGGGRPRGWKPGVERDDPAEVERRMAEIRARKAGER